MIQIVNYQEKASRLIDPDKVKALAEYQLYYEDLPLSRHSRWLINSLAKYRRWQRKK